MSLCVNLTANYRYNHEIYNGQMKCWIMKQATLFHSQIVFSYWNNWQFIAGRWNKLIISNRGIHRPRYSPWQFVFSIHSSFHHAVTPKGQWIFLFQCYYFKLKCNIKVEQEMAIQHLTVLRKFPLQCYNLLCHCERLDKSIRWKVNSIPTVFSLACLLHVW